MLQDVLKTRRGRVNAMCSLLQDDIEGVNSAFLLQVAIQGLMLCVNYVTSRHLRVNVVYFCYIMLCNDCVVAMDCC